MSSGRLLGEVLYRTTPLNKAVFGEVCEVDFAGRRPTLLSPQARQLRGM